jgi:hypothetical protein
MNAPMSWRTSHTQDHFRMVDAYSVQISNANIGTVTTIIFFGIYRYNHGRYRRPDPIQKGSKSVLAKMWGRRKTDKKIETTKTSAAVPPQSDPSSAAHQAPARNKQEDPPKNPSDSANTELQEQLNRKITFLESELQSKTDEVDDLNSNLSLAKESLR